MHLHSLLTKIPRRRSIVAEQLWQMVRNEDNSPTARANNFVVQI